MFKIEEPVTDEQLLRYLHSTKSDIFNQIKEMNLPTEDNDLYSQFMKAKAVQIIIRQVLGAINMAVMNKKSTNTSMTAQQEE
jgi:hypothetical protein